MTIISINSVSLIEQALHASYHQAPGFVIVRVQAILTRKRSDGELFTTTYTALVDTLVNALPSLTLAIITATRILRAVGRADELPPKI